jgi:hypothetical protein
MMRPNDIPNLLLRQLGRGSGFSGKDTSKVERSGACYRRWIARQLIEKGIAGRAEIQVAYAFGKLQPVSVKVDTFGTGYQKFRGRICVPVQFPAGSNHRVPQPVTPAVSEPYGSASFEQTVEGWERCATTLPLKFTNPRANRFGPFLRADR